MSDFKWMKRFAKLITYCIIGGGLAFIICSIALYVNAQSIAKDISRNYLMSVCADGCSNYDSRVSYYTGIIKAYESKYIVIPGSTEDGGDNTSEEFQGLNEDDTAKQTWGIEVNEQYIPEGDDALDIASAKCLQVYQTTEPNSTLINKKDKDYVNYVQRGTPITVTATVNLRYYLPFKFGVGKSLDDGFYKNFISGTVTFPISASTTGISTRYFRTNTNS